MTAAINSLNLNPNIQWWIKIGPSGGQGLVEFFTTKADRDAGTNRVAYGIFAFGAAVEVVLTQDAETPVISLFNDQNTWHCICTFLEEDPQAIFAIGPFTDKQEVIDPLLVDSQPILDRATREIDEGTHIKINRDLTLGVHIQGLEGGNTRKLQDNMRGLDQSTRVESIGIHGDKDTLVDTVRTGEFKDVKR
jgi:hypothetical protein